MKIFTKMIVAALSITACLTLGVGYSVKQSVSALTETKDLEYYTQSLTNLNEMRGQIMVSDNQALIRFFVMGHREGCVIGIDDMNWEVTGTADSKFKCGKFEVWGNGENPYGETYCLVTADSPGTVNVKGTEINGFNKSELLSFYINLNVNEDGNFDNDVNYDNPIENKIKGDVNADGEFNVADVVALQKWLLGNDVELKNWKAADLCEDDKLDVFDLCLMKRELINSGIVESPILTIERESYIPGENGYETLNETKHLYESSIENTEDLKAIKEFVANASDYKDCEMTDIGLGIGDYGLDTLKAYYTDENGIRQELILCEFGGMCRWLDNTKVQNFVEMLIEKEYFADKDIFEWYKNNHSTNEKITWEIISIADSKSFRENLDKEYIITSTKELGDYFYSIYGSIIHCDVVCPENETVTEFFNKYDYKFFENNVLLMKPFIKTAYTEFNIDGVECKNESLSVYYTTDYIVPNEPIPDYKIPHLALVIVPKSMYHAEKVKWFRKIL